MNHCWKEVIEAVITVAAEATGAGAVSDLKTGSLAAAAAFSVAAAENESYGIDGESLERLEGRLSVDDKLAPEA